MYLSVLSLPLLNFLFLSQTGWLFKKKNLLTLAISFMAIVITVGFSSVLELIANNQNYIIINSVDWLHAESIEMGWKFIFDNLTAIMLIVVGGISICVHYYSIEYMKEDPHVQRFISYLSFFTFFMMILVTGENMFQMFMGWEGVGLCSYLLINFWFHRLQANKAALKAMIVNRVGDVGIALGLFLIFVNFKSISYDLLKIFINFLTQVYDVYILNFNFELINLIALLLFIGAVGKSAQIGLHTWLPDAMEGPTPVSALIHAATMVTAGIFLICRTSYFFEESSQTSFVIIVLGAFTAFIAGTIGLVQNDLKRVIAYSTCSQLGYMAYACGSSYYSTGFYHLTNHAFFKAALFMAAGSVIHAMQDEQDMRKFGGLRQFLIFTFSVILIASLSLIGFPFLTGFFSKDAVLEAGAAHLTSFNYFGFSLGILGAFITAFYSIRSLSRTFLQKPLGFKQYFEKNHESMFNMNFPLIFLSIAGIGVGFLFKELIIGLIQDFWTLTPQQSYENHSLFTLENLPTSLKLSPLILTALGASLSFVLYNFQNFHFKISILKWKISYLNKLIYTFFNKKWFFDKIYNEFINQNVLSFAYKQTYQNVDRGAIEISGPEGFYRLFYLLTTKSNRLNFTFLFHYLWILTLSFICFFFIQWLFLLPFFSSDFFILDNSFASLITVSILILLICLN